MIKAIIKPFVQVLLKKKWSLLKTLIVLAAMKRLRSKSKSIKVRLGQYFINAPDYNVVSILLKEKFIDEEYYFQTDKAKPVIIDCGANIGISALYFKSLYPDCEIHCFEPYEVAYEYLKKNVKENHFKDVFLYRKAVSDIDGEMPLFEPENDNIINASVIRDAATPSYGMVESAKLSTFLNLLNEVDLIKLDIEGAETAVMRDLYSSGVLTSKKVKCIIIEYHTKINGSPITFDEELNNTGYKFFSKVLLPDNPQSDILITATLNFS